jgi:hypothetical protein
MRAFLAFAVLAGCHAQLADATVDGSSSSNGGDDDGGINPQPSGEAGVDAAPACANGRQIYLAFEGVTLTQGASDATTNKAVWLGVNQANVPPFHQGSGTRAQDIQTVVDLINAKLMTFPMTVTQTRPAAGPYVMVVFGGNRNTVGVPYTYAANRLDCGDVVKSDVVWVGDNTPTLQKVADFAVGGILFGLGMTGTSDPNDCMCGWLNGCQQPNNSACTLGTAIAADQRCSGQGATQDEMAAMQTTFCMP